MIAAPNDIAELFLTRRFIEEAKFFGPNLIENNATGSCLDDAAFGISSASNGLDALWTIRGRPRFRNKTHGPDSETRETVLVSFGDVNPW